MRNFLFVRNLLFPRSLTKGSPFGRAPDEQGEAGERAFLQPSALSPLRLASQATSPEVGGFL